MLQNRTDMILQEILNWINQKKFDLSNYHFDSITGLPDPNTNENRGYEYTFISSDSMIRIWYEFPNTISCRGYDNIRTESL